MEGSSQASFPLLKRAERDHDRSIGRFLRTRAARRTRHVLRMLTAVDSFYSTAKGIVYPGLRYGFRWTIEGLHHVERSGPAILASNHISYLDPLTLAYVANRRGRRVRFLAKAELFDKRILGSLLRGMQQIPVQRGHTDAAAALDAAVDALSAGECVAVFPEGTISLDLNPMVGRSGTVRLAARCGIPVTPVGLWGSHRIIPKGRKPRWRWGIAQVAVVGPPLRIEADEHVRDATDRVMAAICACVARAREIYPQHPENVDAWWAPRPETAILRSCRPDKSDADVEEDGVSRRRK